ncbi:MAG: WecB/TagA/CpsF family glycosyltransferase [Myxococcales bacterium]|nr:WecB/TagA/CpsF family glycosyltransferase [Myxococcales bacterium]
MHTVDVGGVAVGALDRQGWVRALIGAAEAEDGSVHHHVSLNAAKWVALRRDPRLRAAVDDAASVAADGMSVVWASALLRTPVHHRVPGADLAADLVEAAEQRRWRVALVGALPGVVAQVKRQLEARGVRVCLAHHGHFPEEEEARLADAIHDAKPRLLLLALGTPRAELFAWRHGPRMGVPLVLGVGGTFDVWAGRATRAPRLLQRMGLEGVWRFASAPRTRFRRAVVAPVQFALAMARGKRLDVP